MWRCNPIVWQRSFHVLVDNFSAFYISYILKLAEHHELCESYETKIHQYIHENKLRLFSYDKHEKEFWLPSKDSVDFPALGSKAFINSWHSSVVISIFCSVLRKSAKTSAVIIISFSSLFQTVPSSLDFSSPSCLFLQIYLINISSNSGRRRRL